MTDEQGARVIAELAAKAPFTFRDAMLALGIEESELHGDVIEITNEARAKLVERIVTGHAAMCLSWAARLFSLGT